MSKGMLRIWDHLRDRPMYTWVKNAPHFAVRGIRKTGAQKRGNIPEDRTNLSATPLPDVLDLAMCFAAFSKHQK